MLSKEELAEMLDFLPSVKYGDLLLVKRKDVEVALRDESLEVVEDESARLSCRVLDKGYGVSSTNRLDRQSVRNAMNSAVKQSRLIESNRNLAPVKQEEGEVERKGKKEFSVENAKEFLLALKQLIKAKLSSLLSRTELIITYSNVESSLASTEGTKVKESAEYIDVTLYIIVKGLGVGYASKIVGGQGGFEIIESRNWDMIIDDLINTAIASTKAKMLSPFERGSKFKVILDNEASGTIAHEIAHMLEGDQAQVSYFINIRVPKELEIVDNPEIPGGYGSFTWDNEGVRGRKKVLINESEINLLHTRLTARKGEFPGNAKGITHIPKPGMSNVYIKPSDWKIKEIFEETRNGIFVKGVVRAETNVVEGIFELIPEIAYLIVNKEIKTPLKNLKIVDTIRNIIQNTDAIGSLASLRPNYEKGFLVSEGGPFIRVCNLRCS
jgi:TldD protein